MENESLLLSSTWSVQQSAPLIANGDVHILDVPAPDNHVVNQVPVF